MCLKDFGHEDTDVEPKERRRLYDLEWEGHLERRSEEVLLERTPAVAIDMIYYFDIPEDFTSEQLSEIGRSGHNIIPFFLQAVTDFFLFFSLQKNSLICLEHKTMTPSSSEKLYFL